VLVAVRGVERRRRVLRLDAPANIEARLSMQADIMATPPPDWADRQGGEAFSEQGPDRLCHGLADQQRKTKGEVIAERTNKTTTLATSKSS
jgi:hypothetical protein